MEDDSDCDLERDVESLREVLQEDRATEDFSASLDTARHLQLCLKKNEELQAVLYDTLKNVEKALLENKRKGEKLRFSGRSYFKQACTLHKYRSSKSYFRDFNGKHPDLQCHLTLPTNKNYCFEENTWNPLREDLTLRNHILVEAKDMACAPLQEKLSETTDEEEVKQIKAQITEVSSNCDTDHLLKEVCVDDIDWESIARRAFDGAKTSADCRQRWISVVSVSVNNLPWTKVEAVKLMKLGKEFGGRNWKEIAECMGTHRFVFSYFKKYQTTFNSSRTSRWNGDLDQKLKEAVKQYGTENWYAVANRVRITAWKCRQRWQLHVNPNIKRGRWLPEEDKHLQEAFTKFGGKNWCQVSSLVPNRTPIQCRERWANVLNPNLNKGKWTSGEDTKLIEVCKQYEGNVIPWAKVAALLPKRTDSGCFIRWKMLTPQEKVSEYYKVVKKKRKIGVAGSKSTLLELPDFDDDMIPDDGDEEVEVGEVEEGEGASSPNIPGYGAGGYAPSSSRGFAPSAFFPSRVPLGREEFVQEPQAYSQAVLLHLDREANPARQSQSTQAKRKRRKRTKK